VVEVRQDLPPAIVLNMHETGLGIARSLGRRGVRVMSVSRSRAGPGRSTRYATSHVGPDPNLDPVGMCDLLLSLARSEGGPCVVFPTNDTDLMFLDGMRERLSKELILAIPEREALDALVRKERLAAFARSHGIDAPATWCIRSRVELERAASKLQFPAVVKPVSAADWRRDDVRAAVTSPKGIRLDDERALYGFYDRIGPMVGDVLVQEWIEGDEDEFYILGAAFGREATPLGSFTARKRLQYPSGFGLGCVVETCVNPAGHEAGMALLSALRYRGAAEAEFKRDKRTGAFRLVEINPRMWDQHPLGWSVGVDVAWLHYRDLAGLPARERVVPATRRAVWIRGSGVLGAAKEAAQTGNMRMPRAMTSAFRGRRCYAFLDFGDIRPFLSSLTDRFGPGAAGASRETPEIQRIRQLDKLPTFAAMRRDYPDPSFYASRDWYAILAQTVFPETARLHAAEAICDDSANEGSLLVAYRHLRLIGVPFAILASCTCPYTVAYGPAISCRHGDVDGLSRSLAKSLVASGRPGVVWLDSLSVPESVLDGLKVGLAAQGYWVRSFDHFRNWFERLDGGFAAYWQKRPSKLRHTVKRNLKKLERDRVVQFELLSDADDAEKAIEIYQKVDAASWKGPEPFPRFIPTLIREGMKSGVTHVSTLSADGIPIAAQIWVVDGARATNFKLSHLEASKRYSPGSLLTWWTIKQLSERFELQEIDFGRGDDGFKSSWMAQWRHRRVLIACRKSSLVGFVMSVRHLWLPRLLKRSIPGRSGSDLTQ